MTAQYPRTAQVDMFFARHRAALPRQGAVVATWRRYKGQRQGPFFRLDVRDGGGRKKALYLGKEGNPLVADVRARLAQLQQPLREQRQFEKARKILRQAQQTALAEVATELQKMGLRLQGLEIRGFASVKRALASTNNSVASEPKNGLQPGGDPRQELENQRSGDQLTEAGHFSPELEKRNLGDQRISVLDRSPTAQNGLIFSKP